MKVKSTYLALAVLAGFGLALGACSSSSDDPAPMTPDPDPPAPVAHVCDDGPSQACVDARQAELAALGDDATVGEQNAARQNLANAQNALAAQQAAAARAALVAGAMCTDATEACVMAHQALVDALAADLSALQVNPDATNADIAAAQRALNAATMARDTVQTAIDDAAALASQTMALNNAVSAATAAVGGLARDATKEEVQAARDLIAMAQTALAEATSLSSADQDAARTTIGGLDATVMGHEARIAAADAAEEKKMTQRNAVNTALAAVNSALATLNDDLSDATDAEVSAVESALMELRMKIAEATDISAAEMAAYNAAASTISSSLTTAKTTIAANAAEAEKMRVAQMTADAKKLLTALDPTDVSPTAPSVTVAASSAGAFSAKSAGYTAGAMPDMVSGHRGATLERDSKTLVVYSDIADAKATPIGDIYSSAADPGKPVFYTVQATVAEGDHNIAWADAKRANDVSTTTGSGATAKTTFAGTVKGLAGTFSCTGTACTAPTPDADGAITSSESWTFVPTDPNGTIDVADTMYLQFGWWLDKGTGSDPTFEVDVFSSATGYAAINAALPGTTEGSATYKGGAAGKWALLSTVDNTGEAGHFTADATLTVDFDADTTADTPANDEIGVMVSGTIDNFMTGDTARPDWSVSLVVDDGDAATDLAPLTELPANVSDTATNLVATWDTGGAVKGTGTWSGTFVGAEEDTTHPLAITGEFNAAIAAGVVGRIDGAFGATKQ